MKKFFIILFILFLTGCNDNSFAEKVETLKSNIAVEMGSTANFSVEENFYFQQFGVSEEEPFNREIEMMNHIDYDNNVIYTESDIRYVTKYQGTEERGSYNFDSYKDLLTNKGYVKPINDWYEIELTQMYKIGMASIDPVAVVQAVLYENNGNVSYRGEHQVSVEPEMYRYVQAEIHSDVFERLFASSIFKYVKLEYDYVVETTMHWNDEFQVDYIEFNISKLLKAYTDYQDYELKNDINSIRGSYRLDFSNYNAVEIDTITEYTDWILDEDYTISRLEEDLPETSIGEVRADVVYNDETTKYQTNVSIELHEDIQYLYYELYFYRDGEIITSYYSEYYNVLEFDDLILYYIETDVDIDEIYFVTRYFPKTSSDIYHEGSYASITVEGPVHNVDLDFGKYNDTADELVPNVLIESLGIIEGKEKYELYLDMYALEETRNDNVVMYLYENNILKQIIRIDDLNIDQYEDYSYRETLDFKPDAIYMDLTYKTSYLWFNEKHIKMNVRYVEDPMDFSDYNEEIDVKTYEIDDSKWYADKYLLSFNLNNNVEVLDVYVYFVNEDGEIVGWEHIYDFNTDEIFEVVTDLYEEQIENIYLEIDADGMLYKIVGIYGIIQ